MLANTSTFSTGMAHSLIPDSRFRVYVHPTADIRNSKRPERAKDRGRDGQYRVTPGLQPRCPCGRRGNAPRSEDRDRGNESRARGGCTLWRRTGVGRTNPARNRDSRDSLGLRPPTNKYQDGEQQSEYGKPFPVTTMSHNPPTHTRQHEHTSGIDSGTGSDIGSDTEYGTTTKHAEKRVLA